MDKLTVVESVFSYILNYWSEYGLDSFIVYYSSSELQPTKKSNRWAVSKQVKF